MTHERDDDDDSDNGGRQRGPFETSLPILNHRMHQLEREVRNLSRLVQKDVHEMTTLSTSHNQLLQHISGQLQAYDRLLYGDGDESPGIRIDLDRIKRTERNRVRHLWAVWTALLAGGVGLLAALVK